MTTSSFPLGTSEGAHTARMSFPTAAELSAATSVRPSSAYKMPARPYKRASICAIPPVIRPRGPIG